MSRIFFGSSLLLLLAAGCGGVQSSPVAPDVLSQPSRPAPVGISVQAVVQGAPPVLVHHLTTVTVPESYRYRWAFDDGLSDTTLVPRTVHAYTRNGQYRASVTVVDGEGQVIGVGTVAIVIDHLD